MFLFQQDGIPESLRIKGEFLFVSASPSPPLCRVCATCSIRVGLCCVFFPWQRPKHGICCGICTTHSVKDSWFQFFNRTTSKNNRKKREHTSKRIKAKNPSVSYCNRFVRLSRTKWSHIITFKLFIFILHISMQTPRSSFPLVSSHPDPVSVPFLPTPDPLKLNCKG